MQSLPRFSEPDPLVRPRFDAACQSPKLAWSIRFGSILSIPNVTMRGVAADLLTPTGAVIPTTATLEEAEQRLVTLGVSELYVLAPDGQLAGVLLDYDVLKLRLAGELNRR